MDFNTLDLEKTIILPENYREVIFDKAVLAIFDTKKDMPEVENLHKQGFYGTRGVDGRLNVYLNINYKMTEPFKCRIIPNYEDPNDRVLRYGLDFSLYYQKNAFLPFFKYLNEWGRANRKESINLGYYMLEWLLENIGEYDEEKDGFEAFTYIDNDEVLFKVTNEAAFMRLLKEISAAFRTLASEHANTQKDSYDNYGYDAILYYKEKDLADVDYNDLTDNILAPVMGRALQEGIDEFHKSLRIDDDVETNPYEGQYADNADRTISLSLNPKRKSLMFYRGDKCKGKAFFEFKMGAIVPKCVSLATDRETPYSEELARWFKEAADWLPNRYRQLKISIKNRLCILLS